MSKKLHAALLCKCLLSISLLVFAIFQQGLSAAACVDRCTESSLYQSENSPLRFTVYQLKDWSGTNRSIPVIRHEYQLILTQGEASIKAPGNTQDRSRLRQTGGPQGYQSITIYDALAQAHTFRQLKNGSFKAQSITSGHLTSTRAGFKWTTPELIEYVFTGSRLHTITYPSGHKLSLSYNNGQLVTITDDAGESLSLLYDQHRLVSLKKPNGTYSAVKSSKAAYQSRSQEECKADSTTYPQSGSAPSDDSSNQSGQQADIPFVQPDVTQPVVNPTTTDNHCDSDSATPHVFQTPFAHASHTTMIDARPASCESYFVEYYGTVRGFEIEAGLASHPPYNSMQATIRVFPVVDFIDGGNMYVVHSRDLGSSSYNSAANPEALLDALLAEGRAIRQNFLEPLSLHGRISASELGQQTTIHVDDVDSITLQMIIRDGIASSDHWLQMEAAREQLVREYGIDLQIIVIP